MAHQNLAQEHKHKHKHRPTTNTHPHHRQTRDGNNKNSISSTSSSAHTSTSASTTAHCNSNRPYHAACHSMQRSPTNPSLAPTISPATLTTITTSTATAMAVAKPRPGAGRGGSEARPRTPRRRDDRLILHFDYDCFYASVFEKHDPSLKSKPLAVRQKSIIATCNYVARARGVKKLSLLHDARKVCPDLVVVDGEDLTLFRKESKALYAVLASVSWNSKVERLGLDEVFLDVTDIVDYNISCLNRDNLANSFFHLSRQNPQHGFACDLTSFSGFVVGLPIEEALSHALSSPDFSPNPSSVPPYNLAPLRLLLGSHLAAYLRQQLEYECGFTSACGIATNKLLSKVAGTKHKPRNQTTVAVWSEEAAVDFMDSHTLRQIPAIGSRLANALYTLVYPRTKNPGSPALSSNYGKSLAVSDVRGLPGISPSLLEKTLAGPGAERGIGERVWGLLHGVDNTPVKDGGSLPTQISIEDSYRQLCGMERIYEQLHKLSTSLIRRMRADLLQTGGDGVNTSSATNPDQRPRWVARPKTLRLSLKNMTPGESIGEAYRHRVSRSQPVPSFLFNLDESPQMLASRLVEEALKSLLRKFGVAETEWQLILLNVCVTNMVATAGEARGVAGSSRDIVHMFQQQDEVLRPFKLIEMGGDDNGASCGENSGCEFAASEEEMDLWESATGSDSDEDSLKTICPLCGRRFLSFAMTAHLRYHDMGEPEDPRYIAQ
ncbi:DNA polymerase iota [Ceratocystis lukuohia]|uniref:DNA polymerase iota n=1 Tax=Ceratocystis lukuohia TaxID=2019550 RepID=A0ABR4MD84_9PEZI